MEFKEMFKPLDTFVLIRETKRGVETYVNEDIKRLSEPIKAQIRAFIVEVGVMVGGKKK